jgi:glutamate-5-semialdehyde dehydrogenase
MATALDKIKLAKAAAPSIGLASTHSKNSVLRKIAELLPVRAEQVIAGNAKDLENAVKDGMSVGLQDRLRLDRSRVEALAKAVLEIAELPDPVGDVIRGSTLPNGLKLQQVRVPFGVVGAIYEARPNVTIDIAALAIKSGNAAVLRGGTAAQHSNEVLVAVLQDALEACGINRDAIQSVDEFGRAGAQEMMQAVGLIDVLIPRGGHNLIQTVLNESKVPVIETGEGVVHVFIDETARVDWAVEIMLNSKTQKIGACNAVETMLVHSKAYDRVMPELVKALQASQVTLHGDDRTVAAFADVVPATEHDWQTEYLAMDLAIRTVDSLDEALEHISKYSTKHTEAIITEDYTNAERFINEVDAAAVIVNASTRFTDGGEFGFGAEVGISTQKLHARGPMGLPELTSTKWIVRGSGHVRD